MATLKSITDEIESYKATQTALSGINSTSQTSIWTALKNAIGMAILSVYNYFDLYKAEIETKIIKSHFGTTAWWIEQVKAWQYGYALTWNGSAFVYSTDDASARIVTQAALTVVNKQLQFKVAKTVAGVLAALSNTELTALNSYLQQIKFAGSAVNVISQPADFIRLEYKIYYNAQYDAAVVEQAVRDAADNYFETLVFNGRFSVNELTDTLQLVEGVNDPYFESANGRGYLALLASAVPITEYYTANAGYMIIEDFTITMIAQ